MHSRTMAVTIRGFGAGLCLALLGAAPLQADPDPDGTTLALETCELVVPGTPLSSVGQCGWLEGLPSEYHYHQRQQR